MVPDRLGAEVELSSDLLLRATLLQEAEYLDLAGGEMWGALRASSGVPHSARNADNGSPLVSGTELTSTGTRAPAVETRTPVASVAGGAEHLPREELAGAPAVLRRDDGGEVATANVAEKPLGCRIEPPDDSLCVEDVARDADALQSLLDVAADFQARGHHRSVADPAARRGSSQVHIRLLEGAGFPALQHDVSFC